MAASFYGPTLAIVLLHRVLLVVVMVLTHVLLMPCLVLDQLHCFVRSLLKLINLVAMSLGCLIVILSGGVIHRASLIIFYNLIANSWDYLLVVQVVLIWVMWSLFLVLLFLIWNRAKASGVLLGRLNYAYHHLRFLVLRGLFLKPFLFHVRYSWWIFRHLFHGFRRDKVCLLSLPNRRRIRARDSAFRSITTMNATRKLELVGVELYTLSLSRHLLLDIKHIDYSHFSDRCLWLSPWWWDAALARTILFLEVVWVFFIYF